MESRPITERWCSRWIVLVALIGWTPLVGAQPAAPEAAAPSDSSPAPESEVPESQSPEAEAGESDAPAAELRDENSSEEASEASLQAKLEVDDALAAVLEKRHPESVADLKLIQSQVRRVIDRATPATVAVQVGGAFGSAVIVSPDGLVLTAGHVVGRPGQRVKFIFADQSVAWGETLGIYREIDSGMMRITDPGPWPYVDMAEANDVRVGQWVVAIGQPGGFDKDRTPPVRLGRVLIANDEVISTDCTLVGGDSGGPLFNLRGEVVAIHSRIGRRITENFHVPISTYHETRDRLVAGEEWGGPLDSDARVEARPLLGVAGDPRGEGCVLTQVFRNMPAEQAGLKVGDTVRRFNGQRVDSFPALVRMVYEQEPGAKVKLQVLRDGETKEFEVELRGIGRPLPGSPDLPED